MKRCLIAILAMILLLGVTACGSPRDFAPDDESAVGVIFVNAGQELPQEGKLYADFENNSYAFDLDAAWVYFFYVSADVAYAGDMNFTSMTFGAQLDQGTVGAEGTIAYFPHAGSQNAVAAYYLYRDETGVYFDPGAPFDRAEITDQCAMTGTDYSCAVTFSFKQPAASFTVICDQNGESVSQGNYTPDEVTDYQTFDVERDVRSVTIVCYGADGQVLSCETVTPENPNAVVCFDNGGQFLGSKVLHFSWQE